MNGTNMESRMEITSKPSPTNCLYMRRIGRPCEKSLEQLYTELLSSGRLPTASDDVEEDA